MTLNDATLRQIEAADPKASTWLSANAGSGKTRVLTDRVARLLLDGVDPQNILCLTYTKAAASEMQNRLFKRLGKWSMTSNDNLAKDLAQLGTNTDIDTVTLGKARTLFARAIETPGGLKIQTIHSFCSSILRRFPLEAQVSPQFTVLEDKDTQILRMDVLDEISESSQSGVVDGIARYLSDEGIAKFLSEVCSKKSTFRSPKTDDQLRAMFDLPSNMTPELARAPAWIGGETDLAKQINDTIVAANLSDTMKKFGEKLVGIDHDRRSASDFEALVSIFCREDGTSKSETFPQKGWVKIREQLSEVLDDMHAWMDRTAEAFESVKRIQAFERTKALYAFAAVFLPAYERRKQLLGALDFDDEIEKTRELLTQQAVAQWVLFKLDGGIDHILVDEAQDTSPAQWEVIRALTQEFASGEGASPNRDRTIFVVGDKKQSIYSFQGADPEGFDRMREHFGEELGNVGKRLNPLALEYSFRSSSAILSLVDTTFKDERSKGLEKNVKHRAFKNAMPGRVDLWPVIEATKSENERKWFEPVDSISQESHTVSLAKKIASSVRKMIDTETIPEEINNTGEFYRRPIREGDFLILVQSRKRLFSEIIRELKKQKLEVAGADRLKIGEELAVKDIIALLRFLALPEDNLSLASALKSPLFGWSEQDLYSVAQGRPNGQTLWEAVRANRERFSDTFQIIDDLMRWADFLRPFDLISRTLIKHDGRKKLVARLGEEVEDSIDALLAQSLSYERSNVPNLTGFLSWFDSSDVEVKRQMDSAENRIRVMTVHGSKGLEAPIVILPDTTKTNRDIKATLIGSNDALMWKMNANTKPKITESAYEAYLDAQDEEKRRLLYVAMTRAEKWLIVAAAGDVGKEESDSWYNLVHDGMKSSGAKEIDGGILRLETNDWLGLDLRSTDSQVSKSPSKLTFETAQPFTKSEKVLSPSDLGGEKSLFGEAVEGDQDLAKARGRVIHKLLEHLPYHPAQSRQEIGRRILASDEDAKLLDTTESDLNDVLEMIEKPEFAQLFSRETLKEVGFTAKLSQLGNRTVHGTIDALVIEGDLITIVDFKTNRTLPKVPEQTPEGILRQMGAYAAAIKNIYPNHRIKTQILWTAGPTLMDLPADIVSAALDRASVT